MKKQYIIPTTDMVRAREIPELLAGTQSPYADGKSDEFIVDDDPWNEQDPWGRGKASESLWE